MHGIPHLVIVSGFPSSGKTTVSRGLSDTFGFCHLSIDNFLSDSHKWTDWTEYRRRDDYSGKKYKAMKRLNEEKDRLLGAGRSVVIDASCSFEKKRSFYFRTSPEIRVHKTLVVLEVNPEILIARNVARGRTNDVWKTWNALWEKPLGDGYDLLIFRNNTPEDGEIINRELREKLGLEGNRTCVERR